MRASATCLSGLDISDVVVVNESRDENVAGDVTVFRNVDAACRWLEHWWVESGEGHAFTAKGDRLTLGVDDRNRVVLVGREAIAGGAGLVHQWLRFMAGAMVAKTPPGEGRKGIGRPDQDLLSIASTEELIAFIGFTD